MRLWLGITWIYAGWDKASDPGFLKVGSSTYIGTQLSGFSTQSPVGFAFNKLIEHAVLVGGFVMSAPQHHSQRPQPIAGFALLWNQLLKRFR